MKRRDAGKGQGRRERSCSRPRRSTPARLQKVGAFAFTTHLVSPPPPSDAKKTEVEKAEEADAEILTAIASRRKLASDLELAKGIQYSESLRSSYVSCRVYDTLR